MNRLLFGYLVAVLAVQVAFAPAVFADEPPPAGPHQGTPTEQAGNLLPGITRESTGSGSPQAQPREADLWIRLGLLGAGVALVVTALVTRGIRILSPAWWVRAATVFLLTSLVVGYAFASIQAFNPDEWAKYGQLPRLQPPELVGPLSGNPDAPVAGDQGR